MILSKNASFYLQASIVVSFLAGSSAPTPLYGVYQAAWGFNAVTTTVVFGVYALAVLAALLVAGALSDHVGRRPVLVTAALVQAATMVLFATADSVGMLLAARVVQGLATGSAAAAVGAGMLDLDKRRGAIANAIGPMIGTGTGSALSGLLVQYLPAPTVLVYAVLGAVFVAQALAVLAMPESVARRPGALASLRPHLRVPGRLRPALMLATPALVSGWALVGFYGSLGPSLVRRLAGSQSLALGGLALLVLATGGIVTVLLTRERSAQSVLKLGTALLATGAGVTIVGVSLPSVALFFVGSLLAGGGFGAAFQGAIRSVVPLAEPHERAGVLSVLYVIAYLAMGLPAVLGGVLVVHGEGLLGTAREYGLGVIALALLALAGTLRRNPDAPPAPVFEQPVPSRP